MLRALVCLPLLLLSLPLRSQESPRPILAVFDIEAKNLKIKAADLEALSDYLTTRAAESWVNQVTTTQYDLRKATTDAAKSVKCGCSMDEIVAALDKAVAALTAGAAGGTQPEPDAVAQGSSEKDTFRLPGSAIEVKRCSLGQEWRKGICLGKAHRPNWQWAMKACELPFRLPSEGEMQLLGLCLSDPQCKLNLGVDEGNYWTANDAQEEDKASITIDSDDMKEGVEPEAWPEGRWVFMPAKKTESHHVWCVKLDMTAEPAEANKVLGETRLTTMERSDLAWAPMIQAVYDMCYIVTSNAGDCQKMKERSKSYEAAASSMGNKMMPNTKAWVQKLSGPDQDEAKKRMQRALLHLMPEVDSATSSGKFKCPKETESILGGFSKKAQNKK